MLWRQLSPNVRCWNTTMEWHSVQKGCIITNARIIWSCSSEDPRGDFLMLQDGEGCSPPPYHALARGLGGDTISPSDWTKPGRTQKKGKVIWRVPKRAPTLLAPQSRSWRRSATSLLTTNGTGDASRSAALAQACCGACRSLQKRWGGEESRSSAEKGSDSSFTKKSLRSLPN